MSWSCKCGKSAKDQTDYLPFKGYFIADQDREMLLERARPNLEGYDAAKSDPTTLAAWYRSVLGRDAPFAGYAHTLQDKFVSLQWRLFSRYSRIMHQCPACGRVYLSDGHGGIYSFVPEDPGTPTELLATQDRAEWTKVLAGTWFQGGTPPYGSVEVRWRWVGAANPEYRRIEVPSYRAVFRSWGRWRLTTSSSSIGCAPRAS